MSETFHNLGLYNVFWTALYLYSTVPYRTKQMPQVDFIPARPVRPTRSHVCLPPATRRCLTSYLARLSFIRGIPPFSLPIVMRFAHLREFSVNFSFAPTYELCFPAYHQYRLFQYDCLTHLTWMIFTSTSSRVKHPY